MGEFTTIMARDGHEFQTYLAAPTGKPRGAIVVLQEIFGVNSHIRSVTDGFAAEGYTAIAPSLFDRIRRRPGALQQTNAPRPGLRHQVNRRGNHALLRIFKARNIPHDAAFVERPAEALRGASAVAVFERKLRAVDIPPTSAAAEHKFAADVTSYRQGWTGMGHSTSFTDYANRAERAAKAGTRFARDSPGA